MIVIGIAGRGVGIAVTALVITLLLGFRLFLLGIVILEIPVRNAVLERRVAGTLDHWAAIQLGVGCFQINDIAQRHNAIGNLVAPLQQRPDC